MARKPTVPPDVSEEQVRAVAYSLWLEEGQPEGRSDQHWHRAMEIVVSTAEVKPSPVPAAKAKPAKAAAPTPAQKAAPAKRTPAKKKSS